jgi:hypothetical protein
MNSPVLTGDGRYALGMSFALEEIVPEMMQSFKDMADPEAIKAYSEVQARTGSRASRVGRGDLHTELHLAEGRQWQPPLKEYGADGT